MDLHPQLRAMLDKAAGLAPMHTVPIAAIRATDLGRYSFGVPKEAVALCEDHAVPGPRGEIGVRVYRPARDGVLPVTMFFHGSGFCICSIETHDAMCRQIANRAGSIVVSIDYGLAPEQPFPAGPDDCWAATLWAAAAAAGWGGDPSRLAVCGDSAGGTMAAVVAQRARDEGGPAIAAQILLYPVTDHYSAGHGSYEALGTGWGLTADGMRRFWDLYLPDPIAIPPWAAPARHARLGGLPPAYVITAGYDLLRDEGEAYAARLSAAGVPTTLTRYDDMNHGFLNWVGLVDRSGEAIDALGVWMRRNL